MTQQEQEFIIFAKRHHRDKENIANASVRDTMDEVFQAMKLRGLSPTTQLIKELIDIFGYQLISRLPHESKKDIEVLNYLMLADDAEKFVKRDEIIELGAAFLGEKSICIVGDIVCTEASASQIKEALRDYSSVEKLHASDFRKRESGDSVSKDVYSVIYQQMKNEVLNLTSDEIEQGYEKQIQDTLNMLSEKKLQANEEISSQNYIYGVASGYAKYLATYSSQKAEGKDVEPMLITLEDKNAPLSFESFEFNEFVEMAVDEIAEEISDGKPSENRQKKLRGEIYAKVDDVAQELETKLKGRCSGCELKKEDIETVKKIVLQTIAQAKEKENLIEKLFSTKDSLLSAIEEAEEENEK
ncbi:MAG: hypothetical protein J6A28_03650 [Clostridia bacterium]|nr:hypothetical protein [Clostridia bacterium]